jgi:hypothetical protein
MQAMTGFVRERLCCVEGFIVQRGVKKLHLLLVTFAGQAKGQMQAYLRSLGKWKRGVERLRDEERGIFARENDAIRYRSKGRHRNSSPQTL